VEQLAREERHRNEDISIEKSNRDREMEIENLRHKETIANIQRENRRFGEEDTLARGQISATDRNTSMIKERTTQEARDAADGRAIEQSLGDQRSRDEQETRFQNKENADQIIQAIKD
jgi:hypothetical protein